MPRSDLPGPDSLAHSSVLRAGSRVSNPVIVVVRATPSVGHNAHEAFPGVYDIHPAFLTAVACAWRSSTHNLYHKPDLLRGARAQSVLDRVRM